MLNGNIRRVMRMLSKDHSTGVLNLSAVVGDDDQRTVREVLREKYPDAVPVVLDALLPLDHGGREAVLFIRFCSVS